MSLNAADHNGILALRGISKTFITNRRERRTVLHDLSLTTEPDELLCILGPSGCGKTTLLNIVAGFIPPTAGETRIQGRLITAPGRDRCVIFQHNTLFPWLTVAENTAFGLRANGWSRTDAEQRAAALLDRVGLSSHYDDLPHEISGGMQQRVALARVLVLEPAVLLMDEPFASLDAQTREEMQDLVVDITAELRQTVLFVTHDVAEAARVADRVLLLTRHPGTVRDEVRIHEPKPRQEFGPGFQRIRQAMARPHKSTMSGDGPAAAAMPDAD